MENISFGQYYPGNSWMYRLDPRLKIILTILLMVLLFLIPVSTNGLYMMYIALGLFIVMFLTTRIPFIRVLKGIKPVLFLVAFTTSYITLDIDNLVYVVAIGIDKRNKRKV